jgi:DMSO/TMAO reductase YedYZ molybdopterin-dependent catalytic subunit
MSLLEDGPVRIPLSTAPAGPVIEAAPLASLSLREMPTESHFRRDHFDVPEIDRRLWKLDIGGAVERPRQLGLDDLRQLPRASLPVVLECAGHRRGELEPQARGIQWGVGAMSEAVWTGARLRDLLDIVRPRGAMHVVLEGADSGAVGDSGRTATFARALPLAKALHEDTLLAWEMNGEPLPPGHGAPVRAIVPGWYATDSVKWLVSITLLNGPFDGHFEVADYRVPGTNGDGPQRLTALSIHSLLTSHADGAVVAAGPVELRGIAWGGSAGAAAVDVSIDGDGWQPAALEPGAGPYGRVFWSFRWRAEPGLHTLRVRATDRAGNTQPETPTWNERGFANASIQKLRIGVR